ncbi:MAG: tetratricopeptide repeat protein [Cyclobacteriaceae bacterium]
MRIILLITILRVSAVAVNGQNEALSKDSLVQRAAYYNQLSADSGYDALDSSLSHARKAQYYARKSGSAQQSALAHFNMAYVYHVQGKLGIALSQYDSALLYEPMGLDSVLLSRIWNNLGAVYNVSDNYPKALAYYQKSLTYKLLLGNVPSAATTFNNLGIIKYKQEKFDEALQYYSEAIQITEEEDVRGLSRAYGNMGLVYISTELYDSALRYYDLSYQLLAKDESPCVTMYATNGLADVYQRLGDLEKAEQFALVSLSDGKNCADTSIVSGALIALGLISKERGQFKKAESYWTEAYAMAEDQKLISNLEMISEYLAQLYQSLGRLDEALYYKEQQFIYRDSLFNSDLTSNVTRLEMEYDFSREKDSLSYQFERERASLDTELEKQALIQRVGLIILILALLTIVFFARSYQLKKKSNQLLKERNQLVSQSLNEKEFLIGEIHHRVKNNLQIVSSLLNIQERLIVDPQAKSVLKDTKSRVISMALVHENLKRGEEVTFVNSQAYLDDLLASIQATFSNQLNPIDFQLNIEANEIPSDLAVHLGLIVNEAITNAIKYAFTQQNTQPTISISLHKLDHCLVLHIKDNGVGFDFNQASESYGFKLMRTLTESMEGKLELMNGQGTTIKIEIPLSQ